MGIIRDKRKRASGVSCSANGTALMPAPYLSIEQQTAIDNFGYLVYPMSAGRNQRNLSASR